MGRNFKVRKVRVLSVLLVFSAIINLFAFTVKVNAITEAEQSKLSEAVILYIGISDSYVNMVKTKIDADNKKIVPIIKNGRTLVPVRFISESLNAAVDWDSATSIVTIKLGENTAMLKPGKNIMALNNNPVELDVPAEIIEGRTYLPLRRLVEDVLDKNIFYDRNVIIISEKDNVFDKDADKRIIDDLIYIYGQDYAITHISGGYSHTSAIKRDGTVWEWGEGLNGNKLVPESVAGLEKIIDISAGGRNTLALKIDGTVWSWGENTDGRLGDGTEVDRETPVKVKGLTKIERIAAAYDGHCLALRSDGTVWSWGYFRTEHFEDNTKDTTTPILVDKLTQIEDIAVGYGLSIALDKDGNLWSWGNIEGSVPQKVEGISDVIDISAGQGHVLALKKDGTVWTWGDIEGMPIYSGQQKDEIDLSVPIKVEELNGIVAISTQVGISAALKDDGRVFVWGNIEHESVSDNPLTPAEINGIGVVREIAVGGGHLLLLKEDGSLWGIGNNTFGQIGDGTTITRRKHTAAVFNKDPLVVTEIVAEGSEFAQTFDDQTVKELDQLTEDLVAQYSCNVYQKFIDRKDMEVVVVNNAHDFINAIKSNREIILKSEGVYDITAAINEGISSENAYARETFDGNELVISNVENLIIRSESSDLAKIMVSPTYSEVLSFEDSKNIVIDGIHAGHGPEKGVCAGGVFLFERCSNVYVKDSILFGCGTMGLNLSEVNSFVFDTSVVEDCSVGLMAVKNSKDLVFINSVFRNTGKFDMIEISDSANVLFNCCEISNNYCNIDSEYSDYIKYYLFNVSNVEPKLLVKDTIIKNNKLSYLQKYKDNIYFKNVNPMDNEFSKGIYEVE